MSSRGTWALMSGACRLMKGVALLSCSAMDLQPSPWPEKDHILSCNAGEMLERVRGASSGTSCATSPRPPTHSPTSP